MLGAIEGEVGRPVRLEGFAEDHDKAVRAIEFSLDDGERWTTFPTSGATSDRLVHWRLAWTPERPGTYHLLVRSVSEDGRRSPHPDSATIEVA